MTCKIAISNDYYTVNKKKRWITNNLSRGRGHLLRSSHDCLITSSKTVIRDNPQLTCRIDGLSQNTPSRIILDNKIKINKKSQVIRNAKKYETIIFFNEENKKKIKLLKKYNIKFYKIELDKSGNLDLKKCLTKAKKLGFSRILVESGIKLSKNFLNKNLVNELKIFMSNKKIKKNGYLSAKSFLKTFIKNKKNSIEKVNLLGEKILSYNLK